MASALEDVGALVGLSVLVLLAVAYLPADGQPVATPVATKISVAVRELSAALSPPSDAS